MKKAIHVYDLDGTVIDSSHRYRTITNPDGSERIDLAHWIENDVPEMIEKDSLLPLAEQYINDIKNPDVYVIVATARQCKKGDATHLFLDKYLGMPDKFVFRTPGDHVTKGHDLKIRAIRPLKNLKQFKGAIIKVWEDNKTYLDKMVESLGAIGYYVPSNQGH